MSEISMADLKAFSIDLRNLLVKADGVCRELEIQAQLAASGFSERDTSAEEALQAFASEIEHARHSTAKSLAVMTDRASALLHRGKPCSECASTRHFCEQCQTCWRPVCSKCQPLHNLREHPYHAIEIAEVLWQAQGVIADATHFSGPRWAVDANGGQESPLSPNAVAWSASGALEVALGAITHHLYRRAKAALDSAAWRLHHASLFDVEVRGGHTAVLSLFDACLSGIKEASWSEWEKRRPKLFAGSCPTELAPTVDLPEVKASKKGAIIEAQQSDETSAIHKFDPDEAIRLFPFLQELQTTSVAPLEVVRSDDYERFCRESLLEDESQAAGHGWWNCSLYVVRDEHLRPVDVDRVARCIYPPEYLHPGNEYPSDEWGSSESVGEALAREDLNGVRHIVLHTYGNKGFGWNDKEKYVNRATVATLPVS
jgi:hypothetical protein